MKHQRSSKGIFQRLYVYIQVTKPSSGRKNHDSCLLPQSLLRDKLGVVGWVKNMSDFVVFVPKAKQTVTIALSDQKMFFIFATAICNGFGRY